MRRLLNITLVLLLILNFGCTQRSSLVLNEVTDIIENVKEEYAPDKRTSVYDVTARVKNKAVRLNGTILSQSVLDTLVGRIKKTGAIEVMNDVLVLPDTSLGAENYALVRLSTAQIRRHPEIQSEMISQALMGSEIRLLRKGPGKRSWWRQCQMEDEYLGWIMRSSFVAGDEEFINEWRSRAKVVVIENYSRVFEKMNDHCCQVSDLVRGDKMIYLSSSSGWTHVELPDGRKGYVKSSHVMHEETYKSRSKPSRVDIVKTAEAFNGIPYLWGGTSIKGFDCSGFTQSVYRFNGILLPRDANMQVNEGTEISLNNNYSDLKPGDLMFWGPREDRITHVGIYIGDYRFIHSDGFVHINSLNPEDDDYSEYRQRTLRTARRILNN